MMKFSDILMLLAISMAACESSDYTEVFDGSSSLPRRGPADQPAEGLRLDGGTATDTLVARDTKTATDALVAKDGKPATDTMVQRLEDALPEYVAKGVYAYLGDNPCYVAGVPSQGGGWDPNTGRCYPPADNKVTSGMCGDYACGTRAPGTILFWDSVDPRFRYWLGAGVVCLPNEVPYEISCI